MEINYFLRKIKDVNYHDLIAVFPMLLGLAVSPLFRNKYRNTWLIGEADNEARDNGYHFYKYMRLNHSDQKCVYFISGNARDAKKVTSLGPIVKQGSISHWIMYFTCPWIISSQKGGKPNAALCAFIELQGYYRPHFVFLQHGVTKDSNDWMMADKCNFDYVIAATSSEYEFMKKTFGYKPGTVQLTGFPRFDNLHDGVPVNNRILIMPTWRTWLCNNSSKNLTDDTEFVNSKFMKYWLQLLNSNELESLAKQYNLEILFYPHRQLQKRLNEFKITNPSIRIVSGEEMDIQDALKSSALMITDWSSVYFDMFYMKRPVIFYQFDEDDFRSFHYQKGWFDYHNNHFANSFVDYKSVISELRKIIENDYMVDEQFISERDREFIFDDTLNSERVYKLLSNKEETENPCT